MGWKPLAPVGLLLGSAIAPEQVVRLAQLAEQLGYAELWVAEDYFFGGGISTAAAALAATEHIPVGTGIVSALVRHPAVLAMEAATLSRIHPGRFRLGVALGDPLRLRQMNITEKLTVVDVEAAVVFLRELLGGRSAAQPGLSQSGEAIQLAFPPKEHVPIYMGGVGRRMLALSAAIADGHLLPLLASPSYVSWARHQIDSAAVEKNEVSRPLIAFVFLSMNSVEGATRDRVRHWMANYLFSSRHQKAVFDIYGITDELNQLADGGPAGIESNMPEQWLEDLAVIGDPYDCMQKIRGHLDAGANRAIVFPMPPDLSDDMVVTFGKDVLSHL